MIATSHVIIGGTIGVITKDPTLAFVAGVASHLICDCFPHLDGPFRIEFKNNQLDQPIWTRKLLAFAAADSIFAFLLTLFLWNKYFHLQLFSPFALGALGAYLPDFIDVVPFWSVYLRQVPGFKQFHRIHIATHNLWRFKFPMPDYWVLGIFTQLLWVIPCLWFLLK